MRPAFLDEIARSQAQDLRGAARRPRPAATAPPRRGLRRALGVGLVRTGYRLLGGTA